jgi:hypothetical protein
MPFPRDLADAIVKRFGALPVRGYALLANVSSIGVASFTVAPDLTVRPANQTEAHEIREAIEFYYPMKNRNPYETEITNRHRPEPGVETMSITELPPNRWRYIVVDHTGGNIRTHAFVEASFFTPWPLELGFGAGNGGGAVSFGTSRGLDRTIEHPEPEERLLALDDAQLQELSKTFGKWTQYTHSELDLRRAVRQFGEILDLERNSALRYLGLFTIIESLLTHDPKPSDPADSLTRQVMKKMVLLGRRAPNPPHYAESFENAAPDTVWKKLYGVRSCIAHGSDPDFQREFAILRSLENATRFLRLAASLVLRQALEEPGLVADLREC